MTFLAILSMAFVVSFAVEWTTGRGTVATLVPVVCFAALVLWSSPEDRLLILIVTVALSAFGGGWGVFSARALKRRRDTPPDVL
jgi:hypothetical protein